MRIDNEKEGTMSIFYNLLQSDELSWLVPRIEHNTAQKNEKQLNTK